MLSLVLQNLESLQSDLAAIDPARRTDAADVVADMAVALRDMLAQADRTARSVPLPRDRSEPVLSRAAG